MSFRAWEKREQAAMALDLVDRISDLPDSILGLILSNLPTKNAVATTILSKRWKSVWMTVHNLDLCCEYSRYEVVYINFLQFVNRILLIHGCRLLNKFRLYWQPMVLSPFEVNSWVSTAYTRRIVHEDHELLLLFNNAWRRLPQPLEMPVSLFNCDSLQSLELDSSIYVSAAIVVCLPKLESLKLVEVYFQSEEIFNKLISGCPMLKYLHIDCGFTRYFGEDDHVITYRISLPSLRCFTLVDYHSYLDITRSLELEASSLEHLKVYGVIPQVYVQGSLSSLDEAVLGIKMPNFSDYDEDYYSPLAKGVHSLERAKALALSADVMWALSHATISLSTKFTRLTKLEAQVACCYCSSLMDFIQNSDSLEVLTIFKQTGEIDDYVHNHSQWNPPVDVPICLSNALKEVSFYCYAGCSDEYEMIGFLLKHGSALEVMQVTCDEEEYLAREKDKLVEEISRLPRKSPACKVEFIE